MNINSMNLQEMTKEEKENLLIDYGVNFYERNDRYYYWNDKCKPMIVFFSKDEYEECVLGVSCVEEHYVYNVEDAIVFDSINDLFKGLNLVVD